MYCQKCRTPLKSDSTLDDLNPATFDLLVGSATRASRKILPNTAVNIPQDRKALYERVTDQPQSPRLKRVVPAPSKGQDVGRSHPADSFIEITQSQVVPPGRADKGSGSGQDHDGHVHDAKPAAESLNSKLEKNERLFSILSSHSDIDHPICTECTALLLNSFNTKLATAVRERDAYASFLKTLQHTNATQRDAQAATEKELAVLKKEEEEALDELVQLEEQKRLLEAELADLEDQNRDLDNEEIAFWSATNAFAEQQHELERELASMQQKHSHDKAQFERLSRTNVYNDTFYISHDGYFGTINGLRLGRLPGHNVEWGEINAAWGQTVLLLQTIAERLAFTFRGYRLRPLGSTSRIEKLEYPQQGSDNTRAGTNRVDGAQNPKVTQLDLFSSGDIALGRVFNHRKFDQGMVAFLDCLSQIGTHVENTSSQQPATTARPALNRIPSAMTNVSTGRAVNLPYEIEGDKIRSRERPEDAVSIKLGVGFSQDESFTKACKYALTCCKYLLAHVSNLPG